MTISPPRRSASRFLTLWIIAALLPLLLLSWFAYSRLTNPAPLPGTGDDGPVWFEDVTDELGLDFVHDPGPTGTYFMPQSVGSGCAFLQDPDGTLFLYLLQNAGPKSKSVNRLYKQLPGGKFQDVTEGSGLGIA